MKINWIEDFKDCLPTKQEVDELETRWGVVLPKLYKSHLLNYAGCRPDRNLLHFKKDSNSRTKYFHFANLCHLNDARDFLLFTSSVQFRRNMYNDCLLYTSPSPRDLSTSRMPSSA